jgi:hypothetical protein
MSGARFKSVPQVLDFRFRVLYEVLKRKTNSDLGPDPRNLKRIR